jgi:hypothetical protein
MEADWQSTFNIYQKIVQDKYVLKVLWLLLAYIFDLQSKMESSDFS